MVSGVILEGWFKRPTTHLPSLSIFLFIYLSIYLRLSSELALISMESGQTETCCLLYCIVALLAMYHYQKKG
ncbi:hypothetical protein V8C40DRAFT_234965 [Trichoderma camerunense]